MVVIEAVVTEEAIVVVVERSDGLLKKVLTGATEVTEETEGTEGSDGDQDRSLVNNQGVDLQVGKEVPVVMRPE